jgi:hypothetical protein
MCRRRPEDGRDRSSRDGYLNYEFRRAGHGVLPDADLTADAFVKFITGDVDQKNMEIS